MTSQTSRPIRSHSSASWLTRAMLTLRKTFSRSLASSAASGDESSRTTVLIRRSSAAARRVAAGVIPPTRRGTSRPALAGSPGLTRSGAKARSKSRPATSPTRLQLFPEGAGGGAGEGRRLEDRRAGPARRLPRTSSRQPRAPGSRSGSLAWVIGVGNADEDDVRRPRHAASAASATVRPSAERRLRAGASSMSSIGEWPARSSATRSGLASTPTTRQPASTKRGPAAGRRSPRPTIAMWRYVVTIRRNGEKGGDSNI